MTTGVLVVCGVGMVAGGVVGLLIAQRRTLPRLEQQRAELAAAQERLALVGQQLTTTEEQRHQLSAELARQRERSDGLEGELAQATSSRDESTARAEELGAQVEELRRREATSIKAVDEARAGLRKVLEQDKVKSAQLVEAERQLERMKQSERQLREQLDQLALLKQQQQQSLTESQAAQEALASREAELAQLRQQLGQFKSRESELAELQGETERLRTELQQARDEATTASRSSEESAGAAGPDGLRVIDVLDTDPDLHAGAREAIRMLYERFTKKKKKD
jgi:myosin heavy subunit